MSSEEQIDSKAENLLGQSGHPRQNFPHLTSSVIYLPPPEVLPTLAENPHQACSADILQALDLVRRIGARTTADDAIMVVESVLCTLRGVEETSGADVRVATLPREDHNEYDAYFCVIRVCGDPARDLVLSLCIAYRDLLIDAKRGHSLPPTEWSLLRLAFNEYAELLWSVFCADQEEG